VDLDGFRSESVSVSDLRIFGSIPWPHGFGNIVKLSINQQIFMH
jgi:hypothetical protein